MKKAVLYLLLLSLLASLFAACGQVAQAGGTQNPGTTSGTTEVSGKVMLYSSMKDEQLAMLKKGFMDIYPKIAMDYYTAGTNSVMTKIATEEQAGKINADILWVGDPTHYIDFKERGLLLAYDSPEAKNIPDIFKDPDNMYIGARMVTLGFVYNTTLVSADEAPKSWEDLLNPKFKNKLVMTDPSFSGTTLSCVAGLVQNEKYGWDFIRKLKENGMELQQGSSAAVTTVGAGEYDVSIGVDYIAETLKSQGGTVEFVHPSDNIPLVTSPIAILKDTDNLVASKLFYDFIISEAGQLILVETFTTPVRIGVSIPGAMPIDQVAAKAAQVDEAEVIENKEALLDQFDAIFKK